MEMISRALLGIKEYIYDGKQLLLFLLAVALFLAVSKKKTVFFKACVFMAALVLCPLTGALLMRYQTMFYDYRYLFGLAPMNCFIATAAVLALEKFNVNGTAKKTAVIVSAVIVLLFTGSGRIWGNSYTNTSSDRKGYEAAKEVLSFVTDIAKQNGIEDIKLVADEEIIEYARACDGRIRLLYGRDIYNPALRAFSYNEYNENALSVYEFMHYAHSEYEYLTCYGEEKYNRMSEMDLSGLTDGMRNEGVNAILIKETAPESVIRRMNLQNGYTKYETDGYVLYLDVNKD